MIYLAAAIVAVLVAALFIGVPYRQAYLRRKELERRGRLKKTTPETEKDSTPTEQR